MSLLLRLLANRYVCSSLSEVRILGDERVSKAIIYLRSTEGIEKSILTKCLLSLKFDQKSSLIHQNIRGFLSICATLIRMAT